MCGRYTLTKKQKEVVDRFNAKIDGMIKELFNAAPTQDLPVITDKNPAHIAMHKWGLIPSWAKDSSGAAKMINARCETLREKPAFRNLLETQRCLVPSDGFYEWKQTPQGKQPYRIALKNDELFAYAGLWERWQDASGLLVFTFTIITTEANELMKELHQRMPVILKKEDEERWLNPLTTAKEAEDLLVPYPTDEMKAFTVSKEVNTVTNNRPSMIQEVKIPKDLTLF